MDLEKLRDADLALTPDSEVKARLGQPSPADVEVLRQLDGLMDQQERDRSKRWTVPLDGDPVYRARIYTTLSLAAEGLGLTKSGGSMWPNEWGQTVSLNMAYIQATRRQRLWGVPLPTFDPRPR